MSLEDRPPFGAGPGPGHRTRPAPGGPFDAPPMQAGRTPIVCGAVIALSVGLYLFEGLVLSGGNLVRPNHFGMLHGPDVQAGDLWRLVTHVFEHGDPLHLLLNMSVVMTLGMSFERATGSGLFAVISLITAMGSATLSLLFSFDVHMLGASGMILGWGGAILPIATQQARRALGTWLVQVAIISFLPGVSWQGHLGGFLFGLVCGLLLKLGPKTFWTLAPFLAIASVGAALAVTHPALHAP